MLKIWLPLPYEASPYQAISALRIKSPVRYEIRQEREFADRYAYFDLDAAKINEPFQIELLFRVRRFEHRVLLHTARIFVRGRRCRADDHGPKAVGVPWS